MKDIFVYPIKSLLHNQDIIDENSQFLLDELRRITNDNYILVDDVNELQGHNVLILVQSGGSENIFLNEIYPYFKGPYYLLTYGANNSLAASLEILAFLNQKYEKAEVLHGDIKYIASRIEYLFNKKEDNKVRLGVFGHPSDWLISSNVDYQKALKVFNIELVDVSNEELKTQILKYIDIDYHYDFKKIFESKDTLTKSYAIYEALKDLVNKLDLKGFTIRCFDLLNITKQTSCYALAKLNSEGIIATCEGDIPSMISMYVIKKVLNLSAFQVNPQFIYQDKKEVSFAHCTIPLDMVKDYKLMTHYESNMGLAIKGDIKEGDCTVFKISSDLKTFYVAKGKLVQDEFSNTRCRTQVKVIFDNEIDYFLSSTLSNHHIIIYGRYASLLSEYLKSLGLNIVI